jgi:predicted regulator of amino acid metabolism with ACT domain
MNQLIKVASNLEATCLEVAKHGTKDEEIKRILSHLADEAYYIQEIYGDGTKPVQRDPITLKQPEADPAVKTHVEAVIAGL